MGTNWTKRNSGLGLENAEGKLHKEKHKHTIIRKRLKKLLVVVEWQNTVSKEIKMKVKIGVLLENSSQNLNS